MPGESKGRTNVWDVLKVLCICVTACVLANVTLASDLRDLSEVKGGAFGLFLSFLGVAVARGTKAI